jgi:hypothetical protein
MLLTSLSALPASCRCRLFVCEVFFLGTAFSHPSQMSDMRPGRFSDIVGNDMVAVAYSRFEIGSELKEDEVCMAVKLRGASRKSTANAAKACDVAMMNVATGGRG